MNAKFLLCLPSVLAGGLCCCPGPVFADTTSADLHTVAAANTQFAADLYGQLRAHEGNLCFSPYSISSALAMTYAGARGNTAKQMARTLHFDLPADRLPPAFAELQAGLVAVQKKAKVQISVANSLWPQQGFAFLPDYNAQCRKYYGTSITPVDYINNPEAARKTINDWVEAKTNQKIVELLKPGMVDGSTRLALINAIYFKGRWAGQFDSKLTSTQPFHLSPEKQVTAPLMRQTGEFKYTELPRLQALELPYAGNDLSMIMLLPRETDGLDHLENELTAQNLASWTTKLKSQKVEVFLPKFKLTSEFSLMETLAALGMPDAFNASLADFSGMDGRKDLFISKVVHQAFVDVNEEGTEAAAATAVTMGFGGMPPPPAPVPVFRADHPFLFLIRDNHDGSILFLGRVTDPTK